MLDRLARNRSTRGMGNKNAKWITISSRRPPTKNNKDKQAEVQGRGRGERISRGPPAKGAKNCTKINKESVEKKNPKKFRLG